MAVGVLSLHGQDPEDEDSAVSSYEEEEEEEEEEESASSSTHLLLLQKRISQTCPHHLTPQALLLLGQASCHPPPCPTINSSGLILTPLYSHLKSLKELIPQLQQPTQVGESSPSCLIIGALDYIEQMSREIQSLRESIQQTSYSSSASHDYKSHAPSSYYLHANQPPSSMVDPKCKGLVMVEYIQNNSFRVRVHCKSKKGLLTSLLSALESLGMIVDQMNFSCNEMLTLDVITTLQVKQKRLDGDLVQQVLQRTISRGVQNC